MCMQFKFMYFVIKVIRKLIFDINFFSYYIIVGDKFDFVVWFVVV